MKYYVGIDIGSTCAKTIVMNEDKQIVHRLLQPTGWSSVDTAQAIYAKLEEGGFDPAALAAIHSPIGLDLGGETPEELAVAIVGEILAVKNGRKGGFLSGM